MAKRKIKQKVEHLKAYAFKSDGDVPLRRTPVSVKLPPDLDEYARSQPNRNQWLIAATALLAAVEKELALQNIELDTSDRSAWICNAIAEKLKREASGDRRNFTECVAVS